MPQNSRSCPLDFSPVDRSHSRAPATAIRPLARRQPIVVPADSSTAECLRVAFPPARSARKPPGREVASESPAFARSDPGLSLASQPACPVRPEEQLPIGVFRTNPRIRTYASAVPRRAAVAATAFREHGCVEPLPPSAVIVRTRVATYRRHFTDRDGDHDDDDDDADADPDAGIGTRDDEGELSAARRRIRRPHEVRASFGRVLWERRTGVGVHTRENVSSFFFCSLHRSRVPSLYCVTARWLRFTSCKRMVLVNLGVVRMLVFLSLSLSSSVETRLR